MKRSSIPLFLILICAVAGAATVSFAASPTPAAAGFDKLKSLVGEWGSKGPDGEPVTAKYSLIAGGTAIQEEMSHGNMVTMYTLDGDSILLTHYCMANNQPRMRAKGLSVDGKSIDFKFVDAANLAKPTDMHMHSLKVTFLDSDRIEQAWSHSVGGKEEPATFVLTRKK